MTKVLILTASPKRDLPIDELICDKLKAMGHDVVVKPCLREGRQMVLSLQPELVVMPPIRNPYSRDFVEICKRFGSAVVSRHTEPSCDWPDWKAMDAAAKAQIVGQFSYDVDAELVWGPDEAEILNRRGASFKAVSVGAFAADVYKDQGWRDGGVPKQAWCEANHLDISKPTILILTAWGFLDMAPDLHTDDLEKASADNNGRDQWMEMIRKVTQSYKETKNILVTIHPGVNEEPYVALCKELGISINTDSRARDLVKHSDLVVHAGSTTALGAHWMDKPAIQYMDQNSKKVTWWDRPESAISRVSPMAASVGDLVVMISEAKLGQSNADAGAIKELELGRYGPMDGQATTRSAQIIHEIAEKPRKWSYFWPDLNRDYNQPLLRRDASDFYLPIYCGVCGRESYMLKPDYAAMLETTMELGKDKLRCRQMSCPWCASRMFRKGVLE